MSNVNINTKYYRWYPYNFYRIVEISEESFNSSSHCVYSFSISPNGTQTTIYKPSIKYEEMIELIKYAHSK